MALPGEARACVSKEPLIPLKASIPLARTHLRNDFAVSLFARPRLLYASYVINPSHRLCTALSWPSFVRALVAFCETASVCEPEVFHLFTFISVVHRPLTAFSFDFESEQMERQIVSFRCNATDRSRILLIATLSVFVSVSKQIFADESIRTRERTFLRKHVAIVIDPVSLRSTPLFSTPWNLWFHPFAIARNDKIEKILHGPEMAKTGRPTILYVSVYLSESFRDNETKLPPP